NSDVVATSPLADGKELPFIPDDLDMVSNDAFIGSNMESSDIEVVATSPLVDCQKLPYIPDDLDMVPNDAFIGSNMESSDIEVVATSPLADCQKLPYIPDDLDMVPNDAFIGPDMVPSDIENFLLNPDEDWNSNLLVEMDKYIAGLEPSCDQLLQPNPEVDTTQEMDSVPPVDDLMHGSKDIPLENASPTGQVQQLTQQMRLLSSQNKEA
nr:heat shock factor (HSF)-type, DNA-binding [Tanacetum cinerariifolium]